MLSDQKEVLVTLRSTFSEPHFGQFIFLLSTSDIFISATKLFLHILSQYTGYNNGDFCITWSFMRKRNWRSKGTISKAKKELLDKGVIELSRRGGRNRAHLYALTLYSVDECNGKLDIKSTKYPKNIWRKNEPKKPLK